MRCKSARGGGREELGLLPIRPGCDSIRTETMCNGLKCLGTSPPGREPPFSVTTATEGEGTVRCSAHAHCGAEAANVCRALKGARRVNYVRIVQGGWAHGACPVTLARKILSRTK